MYKWIKWLLWLAVLVSLVYTLGLALGWFGLQKTLFVFQLWIVTTGLFVFYQTRREKAGKSWIALPALIAHFLSLPAALLLAYAVKSEAFAQHYWFLLNLILVIFMGITWLILLVNLPLPGLTRGFLLMLSVLYLVLLCLQMAGMFNNGKLVFFSGIVLFPASIALVLFGIKKPVVKEEPPVAE